MITLAKKAHLAAEARMRASRLSRIRSSRSDCTRRVNHARIGGSLEEDRFPLQIPSPRILSNYPKFWISDD